MRSSVLPQVCLIVALNHSLGLQRIFKVYDNHALTHWRARKLLNADRTTDGVNPRRIRQGEHLENTYDVICFSHLRWSFVFQRPQHLLSRCARDRRVYFVEEPMWTDGVSYMEVTLTPEGVHVAVPHLNHDTAAVEDAQAELVRDLVAREGMHEYVLWYYTPMALPLAAGLSPLAVVYDCMDQLAAFDGAPPPLVQREQALFTRADVVFTGGQSLYEAKKARHGNVHAFPSSVDVPHFAQARAPQSEPSDQQSLTHPRLGFFGVIDERMDLDLLRGVAAARLHWNWVLLGPVVKVDEQRLPRAANIHYLGSKSYQDLPKYVSGWDVALLPFARNAATEFISPTKTPEYLAAGLPVVSTSIRDVVRPYAALGLVRIADSVSDFVAACDAALAEAPGARLTQADEFLSHLSWDITWAAMAEQVEKIVKRRTQTRPGFRLERSATVNGNSETLTFTTGE